jgi:1-deoxy-D-xylulose-5-phosphate synthase
LPVGKGRVICEGKQVAILCFGTLLANALQAAEKLNASVCDMRFVKPLDEELIEHMANGHNLIVTLEENAIAGGAGSAVSEYLANQGYVMPILHLGLHDSFVDHGNHSQQLKEQGLDAVGIETAILKRMSLMDASKVKPMVS